MSRRTFPRQSGKNGLDLIDEAAHLLRSAPAATLLIYYLGAIPFTLGFLYFWADMSRSPFAGQHLAEAALATAALFFWMKFCQALFARRIRAQLAAERMPKWGLRDSLRVLFAQAVIQPSGLFLLPLALILALPFAWVYAFYQNATALADPALSDTSKLVKKSWKQASLWSGQNHVGLGIALTFGLCVFLNLALVTLSIPSLLKMLLGVESVFSKSPMAMLNTTFLAAIFGLTYLCLDPILKTVYTLRCFYGESLQSGEDLKADLRRFSVAPGQLAALVMILFSLACAPAARTQPAPSSGPPGSTQVSASELDRRIDQVIHEAKYTWRMPREQFVQTEGEKGVITRFFSQITGLVRRAVRALANWIDELLRRLFDTNRANGRVSGFDWLSSWLLLYLLLAAVLSALAVTLLRTWRARGRPAAQVAAQAVQPSPDIADENVRADQLPVDDWTKLARELLESGELRLAMRAFYLASLAHLAQHNLIAIARFKSNREYENELRRRGHTLPELLLVFGENLSTFEGIWYGTREVDRERLLEFAANVDKIRAGA